MDPVTQTLASVTLSRAAFPRTIRLATPILIATALAPDLDLLTSFGGAGTYLRFHRTLLHSLPGALVLAIAIAAIACLADRHFARKSAAEPRNSGYLGFGRAVVVSLIGVGFHNILDLADSGGVQLLWPFHAKWYAWNLTANLDPWILAVLIAALLLSEIFNLVSEEIGERKKKKPGRQRWAIVALAIVAAYCVARSALHSRAVNLLQSRNYRGATPIAAGAFPTTMSPFEWRGVVATDNALIEIEVPLGPAGSFDSERGVTHYKPEPTPALQAAEKTTVAERFLTYARFPFAIFQEEADGASFELRDLRFPSDSKSNENMVAVVDLDARQQIVREEIRFARSKK
jgi:membrane-bound metal-dependent hydrolase YbcI (DUF457 family)